MLTTEHQWIWNYLNNNNLSQVSVNFVINFRTESFEDIRIAMFLKEILYLPIFRIHYQFRGIVLNEYAHNS